MASATGRGLPLLPLLLWDTPPALAMVLGQEGIPVEPVHHRDPLAFRRGRFVLFDGRRVGATRRAGLLGPEHQAIDVDGLRKGSAIDPFEALADLSAAVKSWRLGGRTVAERVATHDKTALRRSLVATLAETVTRGGGVWARLSPFPAPYRSAFNLRVDLDERAPDDYFRFARARRPLDDCTTHFLCTSAYGDEPGVLRDLDGRDVQSHGHYHVVYRDPRANRRNVERARDELAALGFHPVGFAAPEGRWDPGLDAALEGIGTRFSSDFAYAYDDWPSFPWLGARASTVLQVPVHPICEGVFLNRGASGHEVADYLACAVRAKVDAGEPAFVYGHPEGRLGRHPEILDALAAAIRGRDLIWRVGLGEFAEWWRWRLDRRWALFARGEGRIEVQFEDWDDRYRPALQIVRGAHVATIPLTGPRRSIRLDDLAYERRSSRADLPSPSAVGRPWSWKAAVRSAIDWETVTPVDDLPSDTLPAVVKKRLRRWRDTQAARGA